MSEMITKNEVLSLIKSDEILLIKIARIKGKSCKTIKRWVSQESEKLLTTNIQSIINDHLEGKKLKLKNTNCMENIIYETIRKDSNLQAKLMLGLDKSYSTIYRWAVDKSEMLTTLKAQDIINKHFKTIESKKIKDEAELVD